MKFLKPFRLTFVLLAAGLLYAYGCSSYQMYSAINSVIRNHTSQAWRAGFTSFVKGEKGEVLFPGAKINHLITAGDVQPWGRDAERDRIVSIYLESGKTQLEVPCPSGFIHYEVDIQEQPVCRGTNSKFSRWLATVPYAPYFMGEYFQGLKELFVPS